MDKPWQGGCVCGAVRYKITAKPQFGLVCHCTWCQRRGGGAFSFTAYCNDADVEFNGGKRSIYEHRSDETGRWLRTEFCPTCGTTITHTTELRPGLRGIAAGTLDDPDSLKIDRHIWSRSAHAWLAIPEDVDVFEKGSSGADPLRSAKR